MLPAERGRQPRCEGPGTAVTPITASPARRLANQAPVRSTNQKGRWGAGAEERTKRESGRRREEGARGLKGWEGGARRGQGRERPPGSRERGRKRKRIRLEERWEGDGEGRNDLVCSSYRVELKYVLFFSSALSSRVFLAHSAGLTKGRAAPRVGTPPCPHLTPFPGRRCLASQGWALGPGLG